MPYVITSACADIMDRRCLEVCPVDCIAEGARMLYIDPGACIDCGACAPVCPQGAIFIDSDLPADLAEYREVNAQFFLGTGCGPADPRAGRPEAVDHPVVAELPLQGATGTPSAAEAGDNKGNAEQGGSS